MNLIFHWKETSQKCWNLLSHIVTTLNFHFKWLTSGRICLEFLLFWALFESSLTVDEQYHPAVISSRSTLLNFLYHKCLTWQTGCRVPPASLSLIKPNNTMWFIGDIETQVTSLYHVTSSKLERGKPSVLFNPNTKYSGLLANVLTVFLNDLIWSIGLAERSHFAMNHSWWTCFVLLKRITTSTLHNIFFYFSCGSFIRIYTSASVLPGSPPAGWKASLQLSGRERLKAVSCSHTLLGNWDVDKVFFSHLLFSVLSHVRQPAWTPDECAKRAASPSAAGVRAGREPRPPLIL